MSPKPRGTRVFRSVVLFAAFLLPGAVGSLELESRWRTQGVVVDGLLREWPGTPIYLGDARVEVAALNDGEFLYLSLSTDESGVRAQILRWGLTLWFDPGGGRERVLGVRYPIGYPLQRRERDRDPEADPPERSERYDIRKSLAQLEIVGGDSAARPLPMGEGGMEVAVGLSRSTGNLFYELKIPLRPDEEHPWALGVADGAGPIGFGLVSPRGKPRRTGGMTVGPMGQGGVGFGIGTSAGEQMAPGRRVQPGDREGEETPSTGVPGRVAGFGGDGTEAEPFDVWISLALARSGDASPRTVEGDD